MFRSTSRPLEFCEVLGTITFKSNGSLISSDGYKSGAILHLGYAGVACTPSQANASETRLSKIYVGPGESESGDQAILDQYLADTDWAAYSSKLDLWYNYTGDYKE